MTVMMDDANGESRLTYALAGPGNVVKAIAIYISAGFHEGVPCFQLGYAVDESFRKQGIATEVVKKSLDEMRTGFKSHMPRFYVEAVVGKSNEASNRLASKLLSSTPKDGIDEVSGESAFQYFLLVE
jgi:RimJ/RimL family protein N-acetyltransferase